MRPDSRFYGFQQGKHHTEDFGLMCTEKVVGFPKKQKITVKPPFSNQVIDFSNIYGNQIFEERPLTYKFVYEGFAGGDDGTRNKLYHVWTRVVNWLMSFNTKTRLYDDAMKEYYYLADVQEEPSFDELYYEGTLTVTFTAYPFRIYELEEGSDIWDDFDFELDIAQVVKHEVSGTTQIVLYNVGTNAISPSIKLKKKSEIFILTYKDRTYFLEDGITDNPRILLNPGRNVFLTNGEGTIEFIFYKELI